MRSWRFPARIVYYFWLTGIFDDQFSESLLLDRPVIVSGVTWIDKEGHQIPFSIVP